MCRSRERTKRWALRTTSSASTSRRSSTSSSSARTANFAALSPWHKCSQGPRRMSCATTCTARLASYRPGLDRERAANMALDADAASLAVCAGDGRFLGAVTAGALMTILRESTLRICTIWPAFSASRSARAMPSPHRRSAVHCSACLGSPSDRRVCRRHGCHAPLRGGARRQYHGDIFVPAIVYLADAVGTQSEAVAVRGLSLVRTPVRRLLAGEMGTGADRRGPGNARLRTGLGELWRIRLAATVALSVFGASTVATLVGSVLPSAFDWLDYDPALCAGPVGTVIQDVLSLLIYFSIASMLVF